MKLYTNPMTAQIPSGFGMPFCGHAAPTTGIAGVLGAPTTVAVVRERQVPNAVMGDMGDLGLPARTRGTTAWSPPTS